MSTRHVLVVRPDSLGDVLICGPAVRAVARHASRVTMLVSARGVAAARLLPGVDDVLVWDCPWITAPAPPVDAADVAALVERLRASGIDEALVLTSFHQSALPTALVLQLAGIDRIAAISEDYPGTLLTTRIAAPPDQPEPLRMLTVAEQAGYPADPDDDGRLAVRLGPGEPPPAVPYLVVHPGADAPAREYPVPLWQEAVHALTAAGHHVLVTGTRSEQGVTAAVARAGRGPGSARDLGGTTDLPGLARIVRGARAVVVANTGPAHLAAAVGTPVVSLFAPVVPATRWAPHGVPRVLLGDQEAPCAGTRARTCPVPGHPCLSGVSADDIVAAVARLAPAGAPKTSTPQEVPV